MSEVLNPVEIETRLLSLSNRLAKSIPVRAKAYEAMLSAARECKLAESKAYVMAEGTVDVRKHTANIETEALQITRDTTEAAYKHADWLARAIESDIRAIQSIGASVRAAYQIAGRGES